jgi:hypothetical protein
MRAWSAVPATAALQRNARVVNVIGLNLIVDAGSKKYLRT